MALINYHSGDRFQKQRHDDDFSIEWEVILWIAVRIFEQMRRQIAHKMLSTEATVQEIVQHDCPTIILL